MDVQAIKKFYATWAPVIETLPAVLDLAEKGDEFARHINSQQSVLNDLLAKCDEAKSQAAEIMSQADRESEELRVKARKILADANAKASEIVQSAQSQVSQVKELEDAARQSCATVQEQLATAQKEYANAKAQLDAEISAKRTEIQAEIEDLENRKAKAEKALNALREKLG